MVTENHKISRRGFLKTTGAATGFALLGGGLDGFIPGPRPAQGQEIPTIEGLTRGQLKVGSTVTKDNVELVKNLLSPGSYEKVKMGMLMPIRATTTDPTLLLEPDWLEATERNRGQAVLDKNGQLVTKEGKPWIGGFPFLQPKSGLELMWNTVRGPTNADDYKYYSPGSLIKQGKVYRTFETFYGAISMTGRTVRDPKPNYPGHENELYRQIIIYQKPFDFKGAGFLTVRPYDQTKLEAIYGYIPALRRVLRLSTKQRWESPVGDDWFNSDYNYHNDPVLSWNWRIVETRPMLGVHVTEYADLAPLDAGRFARGLWELRPEVYVLEGVPKDPASPYSKKVLYVDKVLLSRVLCGDWYDKQGRLWKTAVLFYTRGQKRGRLLFGAGQLYMMDLLADHVSYYIAGLPESNTGGKVDDWWTEKAMLQAST